jgi:hypothetical protein
MAAVQGTGKFIGATRGRMSNQPTIRLTIIRAIERQLRKGRPEIAVLIVALCSSAVTLCTAPIASILLAAVI